MESLAAPASGATRHGRWVAIFLAAVLFAVAAGGAWLYRRGSRVEEAEHGEADGTTYYCPMHPSFKSDQPGNCAICSMKLVPLEESTPQATREPAAAAIRITPERQQLIGVQFAAAELQPATVEIRAVGKVAYDETQMTHVHTKVGGWIDDVFVDFVGASVRKGQPLFTFYSPDLVASQEEYLLALRAREELGGSSFSRVAEGSRSLVEQARRRLELWDLTPAQIEALEKAGKVSRTVTIHSPVSGVVLERAAYHHGRTVTPELDLYTIVDLSRVWMLAQVYEYELPHVAVGQGAEATLPYDPERKPLRGKVTFVYPFLDPMTRTVQVRMEFPNPGLALKPDAFVNVTLKRDLGRRLIVPKDAVMDTGTTQYVFVDKGDGYLEPREVKAGAEVAEGRIIAEGLAEGERVVTAANFILDSESRLKGAIDAMGRPVPVEAQAGATAASLAIQVETDPSPARTGRNQVRVKVADAQGQPISDAEVSVRLFMPQMVGMAQVDVRATLQPAAPGEYAGEVQIPIAWTFSTAVTVRKAGQVLGTAETSITAR